MGSESRSRKITSSMNHDRISMLPDVIIGEILSLIPTRQAVATSILSRKWRYLWTSIKNLDFDCWKENRHKEDHTNFVKFVNRVISKCTTRELHKFYLRTHCCESHVLIWVNEAIVRNVQMLELNVPDLPGNVFTCRSLTSLGPYFRMEDVWNVPDSIYLPKLKFIHMSFVGELIGSAQKLVSGCPVLEDFSLTAALCSQDTFVISLPLLKRLKLSTTPTPYGLGENECTIVIDAPRLQFLEIRSTAHTPIYVIKNVASKVEAIIHVGDCGNEVTEKETCCNIELLNQLIDVKSLTLVTLTLRGLYNADPGLLPVFSKMTFLKLEMGRFCSWRIIYSLLQASPSIEVLIVEMESQDNVELHWIEPQNVPPCLSSCLQVVELHFQCRKELKRKLRMMRYLLSNGVVLQKFIVNTGHVSEEVALRKQLLKFQRASRYCEVQVL